MSRFTDALVVSPMADGKTWVTLRPFSYDVGEEGSGDTVDLDGVWHSVIDHNRTGHVVYAVDAPGRIFASSRPLEAAPGYDASQSALSQRFLSGSGRARETMP